MRRLELRCGDQLFDTFLRLIARLVEAEEAIRESVVEACRQRDRTNGDGGGECDDDLAISEWIGTRDRACMQQQSN